MAVRRRAAGPVAPATGTQLIAVTYDARATVGQRAALGTRAAALGAHQTREYTFSHANLTTRIFSVPAAQAGSLETSLRATAGVRSVGLTGLRRYPSSVSAPFFPDDPYFTGFAQTAAGAAPTYKVEPLVESPSVPGQWDMHVTRLEYAFAYGQVNNGSGVSSPAALGSPSVKIAIIDTGEDSRHPELASKIVYQRCFITNPSGTQSTSAFSTDGDGHGTDVAGIAAADTGNAFGYAGAGGDAVIYAYRVFPTPDDNCVNASSTDAQCGTDTQDVASAIADAVTAGVNVISLSLGGTPCVNGADSDPTEGAAIADAIAANVVVVAASGNGNGPPVEAPACDPGVIAVGATGLADGSANKTGKAGGSPSAPFEYVASYTDYGSPGAAPGSAAAWGIVAPGGDPLSDTDTDDLHWINNIWTTTPYKSSASDTNFAGDCAGDYPSGSGAPDCSTLIAGTSMAAPHVAGAAALIISVKPSYQSPALMKSLLCGTAADIGDPSEGCGRLDVYRAMATALGDRTIPASQPIP
jgi:subtilisin family serine protease